MKQTYPEEVPDIIASWDTDEELFDKEDKDTIQLVDAVSAISFQNSDDSNNEDSDKEERDIGAAPMQSLQTSDPSAILVVTV